MNKHMLIAVIGFILMTTATHTACAVEPTKPEIEATIRYALPEPIAGFEWAIYRNSAFLKPASWNQQSIHDQPDKRIIGAFAVSPEQFSETKFFEHGFTVQVSADFKKNHNLEPSKGAVLILKPIAARHKPDDVLLFDSKPVQFHTTFVLRYRDAPEDKTPIIVHKYLIADDTSDTLHIFTYESPADNWDMNWAKFGTPMLQQIVVVPFLPASP